jgi:hypothetical protein
MFVNSESNRLIDSVVTSLLFFFDQIYNTLNFNEIFCGLTRYRFVQIKTVQVATLIIDGRTRDRKNNFAATCQTLAAKLIVRQEAKSSNCPATARTRTPII